jgi:hypothetical protein
MRTHDRNIEMTGISRLGGERIAALCFIGVIGAGLPAVTWAAVINRGQEGSPLSEIRPAPQSIYPDQQVITAQPSPSEVDPHLSAEAVRRWGMRRERGFARFGARDGE